jgi:hypothetical protein
MAPGEPDDLSAAHHVGVSDREVEGLALAGRPGLSSKTAPHHVAHADDKIGVRSRTAARIAAERSPS